jgi:hypothetical protein
MAMLPVEEIQPTPNSPLSPKFRHKAQRSRPPDFDRFRCAVVFDLFRFFFVEGREFTTRGLMDSQQLVELCANGLGVAVRAFARR